MRPYLTPVEERALLLLSHEALAVLHDHDSTDDQDQEADRLADKAPATEHWWGPDA